MRSLLIAITVLVAFASFANAADNVVCINKKGALVSKAKCARGETPLNTSNIGSLGLRGPAGNNGILNLSACRAVAESCPNSTDSNNMLYCSVSCNNGEFLLSIFGRSETPGLYYLGNKITYNYSNGLPSAAQNIYYFGAGPTTATTGGVGICCPVS